MLSSCVGLFRGSLVGQRLAQDCGTANLDLEGIRPDERDRRIGADPASAERAFPLVRSGLWHLHDRLADKGQVFFRCRVALKVGQNTAKIGAGFAAQGKFEGM